MTILMKNKVDNFELIKPLLNWQNEGDYYLITLILRKKDLTTSFGNKNNSARLVKAYNIFSLEELNKREEEIKGLCEFFKCRAGISLNIKNEESTLLELLTQVADRIRSKNYKGVNGILNTVNGQSYSRDKHWLLDCDSEEEYQKTVEILSKEDIKPVGDKILGVFPTYNGKHILTKRFDRRMFDINCKKEGIDVEIHKNNFFALYYPEFN